MPTETKPKWTPGPWTFNENGQVVDPTGYVVAIDGIAQPHGYVPPDDVSVFNAHLIAAAPQLYEALQRVMAESDRRTDAYDFARAAMAKARGEQVNAATDN